ncbi:MAG: adenylosuccinate synthase [Armatimonadota bacterium]|nr:adenylosuccinate synthase [Armatimonadota bacterium]MDR7533588.1 adenylosuccinate synthase [Armatimonadota bacterium]MDR7537388.1 adenylosuccinate synthase [Armatimonadota bacterium]
MPVTAVVGGHWGDEGKGKVADVLAAEMDLVIRYNGGSNAGHTIVSDRGQFALHLVPSGVLHPWVTCLIGPGVVVNPDFLIDELDQLEARGVSTHNVLISSRAHIVFPFHIALDVLEEQRRGPRPHGTTKQGIWPAYADKVARVGVRMGDLLHEGHLATQVRYLVARTNRLLGADHPPVDADEVLARCGRWRAQLGARIVDSHPLVQRALAADRRILLEGHLGVMRDLDWGVYPYVTSSTCLPGGAAAGAGIPAARITRVVGVVKAYTTAVGAGPLPTELHGPVADRIRERGHEFGTTTGRPRRCGWFDAVAARFAAEVAGFTELAVMKLDVLAGLDAVQICVGYRYRGDLLEGMPDVPVLADVEPVYETLPGWRLEERVRTLEDLPAAARSFLDRIAVLVGVPVTMAGLGRDREALVRAAPVAGARGTG